MSLRIHQIQVLFSSAQAAVLRDMLSLIAPPLNQHIHRFLSNCCSDSDSTIEASGD